MKFETQSGVKIALCLSSQLFGVSLWQNLWCCDQDQGWSNKEADLPSENATAVLHGRSMFTPVISSWRKEDKLQVNEVIAYINTNISLLKRCNYDWASLLKDLKTEEKVKEKKEYQQVAERSEGYTEILMEVNKVIIRLETCLKVIARIS